MTKRGYNLVKRYYAGFPFYSPIERDLLSLAYDQHKENVKKSNYSVMYQVSS